MSQNLQTTVIFPPSPPLYKKKTGGTFEYIKDKNMREMLINCWQAVSLTEMWEFMKKDPGHYGYMFSDYPEIGIITDKMAELPNSVSHSGFSMIWTLRQIQFIACHGEEEYEKQII